MQRQISRHTERSATTSTKQSLYLDVTFVADTVTPSSTSSVKSVAAPAKQTMFYPWSVLTDRAPGGLLLSNRLMGMCPWRGSPIHDWIDYNGVAFSIALLEWGCTFSGFGG